MNPQQELAFRLALDAEAQSARRLFEHGVRIYVVSKAWDDDAPAVLTCLASAVERMLKLSLGLAHYARDGRWPGKVIRDHAHHLAQLSVAVDAELLQTMSDAGGQPYIGGLRDEVRDRPGTQRLLAALDAWAATSGRYRNLNTLAAGQQSEDSPLHMWAEVEQEVTGKLGLNSQMADPAAYPVAIETVRASVGAELALFWHLYRRAWQHGLFGTLAKQQSSALDATSTLSGLNLIRDLVQQLDSQVVDRLVARNVGRP